MELQINPFTWAVAFLPLAILLFLMIVRRWGAADAGPVAWIVAVLIAIFVFQASFRAVGIESVKGTWSALTILYIVWPAILIYEVTREAGAFEPFRRGITRLLPHPLIQVMAFGWIFASFLQGVTGFGVPIAVTAPLLVGIGVAPLYAVIIPLVGHAWNNTFGTLAVAWLGLEQVTGMSPELAGSTALYAASFIWILNILGGLLVCWLYGRMQGIREGLPAVIPISLVQGGLTLGLSQWNDTLNGFIAGVAAFALIFAIGRLPIYQRPSNIQSRIFSQDRTQTQPEAEEEVLGPDAAREGMSIHRAFIPYYALLGLTFGILLIQPVKNALGTFSFGLSFPAATSGLGFETPASTSEIAPLTNPGTFLFAAALIGYFSFSSMGYVSRGGWGRIWSHTVAKAIPSTIAVVALVAMSNVLRGAGGVEVLAQGVATATGPFYALLAPFIGVLGAFMTSSNLASNLLFGDFQSTTAGATGLSKAAILGAQTAGGATGNMIAPGNVLLGTTTAGILGKEGEVLRVTLPLALAIAVIIGVVVLIVA